MCDCVGAQAVEARCGADGRQRSIDGKRAVVAMPRGEGGGGEVLFAPGGWARQRLGLSLLMVARGAAVDMCIQHMSMEC